MAKSEIPLTNKQLVEIAQSGQKVRCLIVRPDGNTAFNEKMTVTATKADDKFTIVIGLQGVRHFTVKADDKRFDQKDREYHISVYRE